jgi:deazaflavin-dependent oxidoreductase (nitroreductase family)
MSNQLATPLQDYIRRTLDRGGIIDMTTTGRTSGEPRRLEIVFHNIDGRIVISGMPLAGRTRAWLRNLEADPQLTIHLKGPVQADLPATARVVTDEAERRELLQHVARNWKRTDINEMVAHSPLIVVTVPGYTPSEVPAASR